MHTYTVVFRVVFDAVFWPNRSSSNNTRKHTHFTRPLYISRKHYENSTGAHSDFFVPVKLLHLTVCGICFPGKKNHPLKNTKSHEHRGVKRFSALFLGWPQYICTPPCATKTENLLKSEILKVLRVPRYKRYARIKTLIVTLKSREFRSVT